MGLAALRNTSLWQTGSGRALELAQAAKFAQDLERAPTASGTEEKEKDAGSNRAQDDISSSRSNGQLDPAFLVAWDHDDPLDPHNWPFAYKCWVTFQLAMLALAGSLGSSATSAVDNTIAEYIGVSDEVGVLNVSLYIIGFAAGPIVWAPISEVWGRRVSMLPAVFCLGLFSIGTATSKNAASVFITRFFGGLMGSAPVANVTASMGDFWHKESRGIAISLYSVAVVGGPTLGPLLGAAFLTDPSLGWRWTEYLEAIWTFAVFTTTFFFLPELYPSVLLKRKAQHLRKATGNQKYYHPHELLKVDLNSIVTKQLSRPLRMLFTEPIVSTIALYAAFVYSILYMSLEIFPIVFEDLRHWKPVIASLPFLALFLGVIMSLGINIYNQYRYNRISREANNETVPEARLPPMAVGAVMLVFGLFLFGWTAAPRYHWILPCIGAVFIGAGFNTIFQQSLNYLIDVYKLYAASAAASVTFLRSLMASGLPLAAKPMFSTLGVGPGVSVLGGVAALLLPVPFLFMKYGPALREHSKLIPQD